MSTENPYHGITLPSPPAGYRLAKTLADVPENLDVACRIHGREELCVLRRVGARAFATTGNNATYTVGPASNVEFVRYLDFPLQKPLSLDDVPDGRCIQVPGDPNYYWRHLGNWCTYVLGGWIRSASRAAEFTEFTITNTVAEFK